ncbi:MAG: NFACT family protein [Anaerolineae bacterium]|nr:NFACT family protein [Anaerolineae bacterium]
MFFDVLTTAAVADELAGLAGGRVQEVVLVDSLTVGLELYGDHRRRYLLLSAQPAHPRVHLVSDKLRRGPDTPCPLLLLMRKHLRGARLEGVAQPGFERILVLDFEGGVTLLAEVMGRRSNILLLSPDGTIMDAIKRVTPEQSRRPVLPHLHYQSPPPLDRPSVANLTPLHLAGLLGAGEGPLWRRLVEAIAGMSPLLAREVICRATGNPMSAVAEPEALLQVARELLHELPTTHAWAPCLAIEGDAPVAYAPYDLTHLPARRPVPGISRAIEEYASLATGREPYAVARETVRRLIEQARERELRRRASIERGLRPEEEINRLREAGEWILAYATQIAPRQQELVVEGLDGREMRISLDPVRTPVENARRYFAEYDDARAAAQAAPERLAEVDRALDRLAQLETDLRLAENRAEIDDVRHALAQAGYLRRGKPRAATRPAGPLRLETEEGFTIWAGRNSAQNAAVLARAAPHDLWLHARGVPGGHIVLVTGGREVPEATLARVAALAAYYSAARDEARVPVDVAERRHVRPIRGAGPGQVTYREERTLVVEPSPWPRQG